MSMMATAVTASERLNARSAINTIQAERSVVIAMHTRYEHLGEMRQTMLADRYSRMSHISDMLSHARPSATTLRGFTACMVLIAPIGALYASGIMRPVIASERHHARSTSNSIHTQHRVVIVKQIPRICKQ